MLKVADLQQLINGLVQPMRSAGASQKVVEDLGRMAQGLEPFKDRTIGEFNDFLQTAHTYVTDGTLPEPGRRSSGRGRSARADGSKLSVEEAAQRVMDLYERWSTGQNLDPAALESEVQTLEPLTKEQLKQVAEQVHVSVPANPRTKEDLLKAITTAIRERKGGERTPQRPESRPEERAGEPHHGHRHEHREESREAAGSHTGHA
jgi:hypothetical protein